MACVGGTARPGSLALATLAGGSARDLARLNDDTSKFWIPRLRNCAKADGSLFSCQIRAGATERCQEKAEKKSKSTGTNSSLGGLFTNTQNTSNAQFTNYAYYKYYK